MRSTKYMAVLTTLAAIAGVLILAGQLARMAEAASEARGPARVPPGAPYPRGVAVPFPHPAATFSSTPTITPTPLYSYTPTPTATCGPTVSIVSSPTTGLLNGVAALSSDNVWAVGDETILHWDGSA